MTTIKREAQDAIVSAVEREIQHLEEDLEEDARDKRLPKVITAMKSELATVVAMFKQPPYRDPDPASVRRVLRSYHKGRRK